jgi:hypothetical protein
VDEIRNARGSGDALRSALGQHKGLLAPAAVGVAGALAAAKGPSIVRGLGGTVEKELDSTAGRSASTGSATGSPA